MVPLVHERSVLPEVSPWTPKALARAEAVAGSEIVVYSRVESRVRGLDSQMVVLGPCARLYNDHV